MPETVLITGASGVVGTILRDKLRRPGRVLRLLDLVEPTPAADAADAAEEVLTGDITDSEILARACTGVDAIIHLGGWSREQSWEQILAVNIDGTQKVLAAAQSAGVGKVILASSNHAVGFRRGVDAGPKGLPADSSPRPDSYYGVGKAAMEALGSLFHSRFGMDIVVIRIGSMFPDPMPLGRRGLITWLSPDDGARLFEAALAPREPGYRMMWGVSDNTRGVLSLREAEAIGYVSEDDAEVYDQAMKDLPEPSGTVAEFIGGGFCTNELGVYNPL